MRQIQKVTREKAQELGVAVCQKLGLDPNQVAASGFTAEYVGGTSPVVIRWEGVMTMPVEEWNDLLASVDTTPT